MLRLLFGLWCIDLDRQYQKQQCEKLIWKNLGATQKAGSSTFLLLVCGACVVAMSRTRTGSRRPPPAASRKSKTGPPTFHDNKLESTRYTGRHTRYAKACRGLYAVVAKSNNHRELLLLGFSDGDTVTPCFLHHTTYVPAS